MTNPPDPKTKTPSETLWLPVLITGRGVGVIPFPMSDEDFELMIATLKLWKRRLVRVRSTPFVDSPFTPTLPLL